MKPESGIPFDRTKLGLFENYLKILIDGSSEFTDIVCSMKSAGGVLLVKGIATYTKLDFTWSVNLKRKE